MKTMLRCVDLVVSSGVTWFSLIWYENSSHCTVVELCHSKLCYYASVNGLLLNIKQVLRVFKFDYASKSSERDKTVAYTKAITFNKSQIKIL